MATTKSIVNDDSFSVFRLTPTTAPSLCFQVDPYGLCKSKSMTFTLSPNGAGVSVTPERSVTARLRAGAPYERGLPCGLGRRVTT